MPITGLDQQHAGDNRAAEQRRHRREGAGRGQHRLAALVRALTSGVKAMPTTEPRAISGASGPSTAPKAERPDCRQEHPGPVPQGGRGASWSPPRGACPPSPGSSVRAATPAPTTGSPRTRYQGGDDAPQPVGEVGPEPALQRVHQGQEQCRGQGRGDPDQRPHQHQPQVGPAFRAAPARPAAAAVSGPCRGRRWGAPARPGRRGPRRPGRTCSRRRRRGWGAPGAARRRGGRRRRSGGRRRAPR